MSTAPHIQRTQTLLVLFSVSVQLSTSTLASLTQILFKILRPSCQFWCFYNSVLSFRYLTECPQRLLYPLFGDRLQPNCMGEGDSIPRQWSYIYIFKCDAMEHVVGLRRSPGDCIITLRINIAVKIEYAWTRVYIQNRWDWLWKRFAARCPGD